MIDASETDENATRFVEPSQLAPMLKAGMPTRGFALRGAVIRTWQHGSDRLRLLVRDTNYRTTDAVNVDVPLPVERPERGTQIEVTGELHTEPGKQLAIARVWHGEMLHLAGEAPGFQRRRQHADHTREHARLVVPTDRCERLFVVTSRYSDAWADIAAALAEVASRATRALEPRTPQRVRCNLYDSESIAVALNQLRERVNTADLVIVARGGGEWLDNFEDEAVVTALARLEAVPHLHGDRACDGHPDARRHRAWHVRNAKQRDLSPRRDVAPSAAELDARSGQCPQREQQSCAEARPERLRFACRGALVRS